MKLEQFNNLVNEITETSINLRELIEKGARVALKHFEAHNDTRYIATLVNACVDAKVARSSTLKEYIKAHANVTFKARQNGSGFEVKKKGKGNAQVTMPTETEFWYDFDGQDVAKPDTEFEKLLQAAISKAEKAQENGTFKRNTGTDKRIAACKSMLAQYKDVA